MKKQLFGLLILLGAAGSLQAQTGLDAGFGDMNGFDLEEGDANNFILRKDGSIVVNRVHNLAPDKKICYSLNAEGLLNNSFSGDGYLQDDTSFLMRSYAPSAVLPSENNGFLLTYYTYNYSYVFAKFDSAGTRKENYGQNSSVTTPSLENFLFDVDAKNRLVYFGKCYDCIGDTFSMLRHTPDGTPDSSFGTNGRADIVFGGGVYFRSLLTATNSKIFAAGEDGAGNWVIYGRNADGTNNVNFGTAGRAIIPMNGESLVKMLLQPDGKIVLCGSKNTISVVRLNTDGTPDMGFGTNGMAQMQLGALQQIAIRPNGRLVLGGHVDSAFILGQLTTTGQLDNSFGTNGRKVWKSLVTGPHRMEGLAIQPDEKILVLGNASNAIGYLRFTNAIVARFEKNGRLDVASPVLPEGKSLLLDLYPNPAGDKLNVLYSSLAGKGATVVIYDVLGRVMQQQTINTTANRSEIEVQSLAPGLYILELRSEGGLSSRKQFLKK